VFLVEVYRELGIKFEEAVSDLDGLLAGESRQEQKRAQAPSPQDEAASMALLSAMMKDTSFQGPRG
jgi:hypothetical protein